MPTKKEIIAHRHYWIDLYKKSNGCYVCGYNAHPAALCFKRLKEFEDDIKNSGGMYKLYNPSIPYSELLEEIKKCRILCSNCHTEILYPDNERIKIVTHEHITTNFLDSVLKNFEEQNDDSGRNCSSYRENEQGL